MKMLRTGCVSLFGLMLTARGVSRTVRETLTLTEGGVTFTVVRRDDYRGNLYRIKVRQDNSFSLFMFNSAYSVSNIKIGKEEGTEERYEMRYDRRDNLEGVERKISTRRTLHDEEPDAAKSQARRLDFDDCTACEEAWVAVCDGVSSVCALVDFGSPFSRTAAASIDTMCETFGSACSGYEASVVCQDQCREVNLCLDPTSEEYKCAYSGDTSIYFNDCDLTDSEALLLPACFEDFGKPNIQTLHLGYSHRLRSLPEATFSGLSEMMSLSLFNNDLDTVPERLFDGLTKLESLDMSFNGMASLPEGAFSDLASLQTLLLYNNNLSAETLPIGLFSGVPLLQQLDLRTNFLVDMTGVEGLFDGLTELTRLDLDECLIETVPDGLFAGLTRLEDLILSRNKLSSLADGLLSGLTLSGTLDLSQNRLKDLGTSLSGLTELRYLVLDSNRLATVPEGLFDGLTKLEWLSMSDNKLVGLPEGAFSDLGSLKFLVLNHNEVTPEGLPIGLFSGIPRLQSLQLRSNNLEDMTGLEGLFDGLTELTALNLGDCLIQTVPEGLFAGLTKLDDLSFYGNNLSSLPDGLLTGLTTLGSLHLTGNKLTDLGTSLSGLAGLTFMNVDNNDLVLTEDVFSDLINMEKLTLNGCGLTTLPAGIFSPMENLVYLELWENRDLQCLPSTTATDVDVDRDIEEGILDGTCVCTPAEAVFCEDGLSCERGRTGYTCLDQ